MDSFVYIYIFLNWLPLCLLTYSQETRIIYKILPRSPLGWKSIKWQSRFVPQCRKFLFSYTVPRQIPSQEANSVLRASDHRPQSILPLADHTWPSPVMASFQATPLGGLTQIGQFFWKFLSERKPINTFIWKTRLICQIILDLTFESWGQACVRTECGTRNWLWSKTRGWECGSSSENAVQGRPGANHGPRVEAKWRGQRGEDKGSSAHNRNSYSSTLFVVVPTFNICNVLRQTILRL